MGISVDVYRYNAMPLIKKIAEVCKTDNTDLIVKVLSACGTFFGEYYIILCNEFWEDCNAYYYVSTVLASAFGISEENNDIFGECFCSLRSNETGRTEICTARTLDDVCDELGIEPMEY